MRATELAVADIPTEALEAAARAISHVDWENGWSANAEVSEAQRTEARCALAAAAPHLIAEGRRQAADLIAATKAVDWDDVENCVSACASDETESERYRVDYEAALTALLDFRAAVGRIAEGTNHA